MMGYISFSATNAERFKKVSTHFVPIGEKLNMYNNPTE
jgi:hypothetical protein